MLRKVKYALFDLEREVSRIESEYFKYNEMFDLDEVEAHAKEFLNVIKEVRDGTDTARISR